MLNRARILLAEGRGRKTLRGRVAPRPGDSPDARNLQGHGAARAGAFLQAGSGGGARTLGARSSLREILRRSGGGSPDHSGLLGGTGGSGALEHEALGRQSGGARHRGGSLPRDGPKDAQKNELRPHLVKGWVIRSKRAPGSSGGWRRFWTSTRSPTTRSAR